MAGETIRWDALRRRPLAPLGTRRLPALHSGVLRLTGRAFENVDQPRLSASSWRQVLMPANGAPPSPGCFRVRFPEARGAASADGGISPLGRPGEIRPYLRPSPHRCSVFTASHDDAPRRAGQDDNPHSGGCVNSPSKRFCAAVRQPSFSGARAHFAHGPRRTSDSQTLRGPLRGLLRVTESQRPFEAVASRRLLRVRGKSETLRGPRFRAASSG